MVYRGAEGHALVDAKGGGLAAFRICAQVFEKTGDENNGD